MTSPKRRYTWVVDRRNTRLPYSKYVMASSMIVIGVEPEIAYPLAEQIEEELLAGPGDDVAVDAVVDLAGAALEATAGGGMAARYAAWVRARRRQRPILVFLGGAPGTGKSSVAAEVGARLRVTPVIPTDAVREVMRTVLPQTLAGILNVSSFEAYRELKAPLPSDHDAVVVGFRQQAEVVATGIRGLVNRALREGSDLVVEGVHILPGLFDDDLAEWRRQAVVCQAVLAVPDPRVHEAHFLTRLEHSASRRPQRYLDHFDEIRRVDRFIRLAAAGSGIPVVEMNQLDASVDTVVMMVVDEVVGGEAGPEVRPAAG